VNIIFATTKNIYTMKQLTFASLQVKNLDASKEFYTEKLGFEIQDVNPQACVFKYNEGEASFAIRTPLEALEGRELGTEVALWFAVEENVDKLKEQLISNGITDCGTNYRNTFWKSISYIGP
jgi:catechol 2,3-dioxygenase-like lactoylglutathione lyase family enzyme